MDPELKSLSDDYGGYRSFDQSTLLYVSSFYSCIERIKTFSCFSACELGKHRTVPKDRPSPSRIRGYLQCLRHVDYVTTLIDLGISSILRFSFLVVYSMLLLYSDSLFNLDDADDFCLYLVILIHFPRKRRLSSSNSRSSYRLFFYERIIARFVSVTDSESDDLLLVSVYAIYLSLKGISDNQLELTNHIRTHTRQFSLPSYSSAKIVIEQETCTCPLYDECSSCFTSLPCSSFHRCLPTIVSSSQKSNY